MKIWAIVLFIFFLNFVSAGCSGNQIDINSASFSELDDLTGIGPVKAQAIIDARPFDSIEDIIEVYGIGPATLQKIKEQGLACVEEEDTNEEIDLNEKKDIQEFPETQREIIQINNELENSKEETEAPLIKLNAQTIKSEDTEKVLDKSKYPLYGFVGFCILLVVLFIIKARKNKNEFRD